MTTAQLPAVARVGVAAGWQASPSASAKAEAHLMPTSWAYDGRTSRPALCGQRRQRWVAAATVDRNLSPCDRCLAIAEQKPPIGAVVRIAPSAAESGVDRLRGTVSDPHVPSTLADRVGRRCAFRDSFMPSERSYVIEQLAEIRRREHTAAARFAAHTADLDREPDVDEPVVAEQTADHSGVVVVGGLVVDDHGRPHWPLAYTTSS